MYPFSPPDLAIDARGLRKEFGGRPAVRDLTLSVRRGEIFGFLGPNGAGKSTSIKMLLGLVRPTAGQATVLGAPIGDVSVRSRIGFLPGGFPVLRLAHGDGVVAVARATGGNDA